MNKFTQYIPSWFEQESRVEFEFDNLYQLYYPSVVNWCSNLKGFDHYAIRKIRDYIQLVAVFHSTSNSEYRVLGELLYDIPELPRFKSNFDVSMEKAMTTRFEIQLEEIL